MTAGEPGRTPDVVAAEKAVLGSALTSRTVAEAVTALLPQDACFSEPLHQAVYAAVRHVTEAGSYAGAPSVLARLVAAEQGVWRTGQAGVILAELAGHASPDWQAHAAAVAEAAARRRSLAALDRARVMLADPALTVAESADMARLLLDQALDPGRQDGAVTAADLFTHSVERLEAGTPPGVVEVPWIDLRHLLGFLRAGQLVTIGARPSIGKSMLGLDIARHVGMTQRLPCVLFTMEMDRDEVADRLMSAEAQVPHKRITDNALDDEDWGRIAKAAPRFAESALVIDDTPHVSLAHIRARLRGMRRASGVELAIVDYLQLMEGMAGENRQREVSATVSGLKAIAREFRIPVIMLCQLNRGPESRHDKRPYMSDARESGSVENDSDIVILIHRPDFYERDSPRAGEADLIVDKNRNGWRATVTVGFQGEYARFVDLAPLDLRDRAPRHDRDDEWTPSAVLGEAS